MWQAEFKIGESEIAFELMGFNIAMVASNMTVSNEEDEEVFRRLSKESQGPGFFIIIAGNCAADFEYKKKVLKHIINETGGKSLESIEKIPGLKAFYCASASGSPPPLERHSVQVECLLQFLSWAKET